MGNQFFNQIKELANDFNDFAKEKATQENTHKSELIIWDSKRVQYKNSHNSDMDNWSNQEQLEDRRYNTELNDIISERDVALKFCPKGKLKGKVTSLIAGYEKAFASITQVYSSYGKKNLAKNLMPKNTPSFGEALQTKLSKAKNCTITQIIDTAAMDYNDITSRLVSCSEKEELELLTKLQISLAPLNYVNDNFNKLYSKEFDYENFHKCLREDSTKDLEELEQGHKEAVEKNDAKKVKLEKEYEQSCTILAREKEDILKKHLNADNALETKNNKIEEKCKTLFNTIISECEPIFTKEKLSMASQKRKFEPFTEKLILGGLTIPCNGNNKVNKLAVDRMKETLNSSYLPTIPFEYNLDSQNSNMLIEWDGNSDRVFDFIKDLMLKAATSFPIRYCNIHIADLKTNTKLAPAIGTTEAILTENHVSTCHSPDNLRKILDDLLDDMAKRNINYAKLLGKNIKNIREYNKVAPDNKQDAKFLILFDYPNSYTKEQQEKIERLMENGNSCGIFTVLVKNTIIADSSDSYNKAGDLSGHFGNSPNIKITGNDIIYNDNYSVHLNLGDDSVDFKEIQQTLKDESKKIKPIMLKEIAIERNNGNIKFSEELSVPIGKKGSDVVHLEFSIKGASAHLLLAGKTGSGKSIFLHNLILSSAIKYSPNELEFYLIDLKDDVEFHSYKDDLKIPHFKLLATGGDNDAQSTFGMLRSIEEKMSMRFEMFKRLGVNDISAYNTKIRNSSDKKLKELPRAIIIIDEYQTLFSGNDNYATKCIDILENLAKKARAAGIGLVLASQRLPTTGFAEISTQMGNRVVFDCDSATLDGIMDNARGLQLTDLSREKGNAYYKAEGEPSLFRASFPGDKNSTPMIELVELINKEYPTTKYADKLVISGDKSDIALQNTSLGFVAGEIFTSSNDGVAVALGQSVRSGAEVGNLFSKDNPYMFLFGDRERAKNIETVMLLDLLNSKAKDKNSIEKIIYLDFKKGGSSQIGFKEIKDSKKIEYIEGKQESYSKLAEITALAKERTEESPTVPIFVFINSSENISSDNDTQENVDTNDTLALLRSMGSNSTKSDNASLAWLLKNARNAGMRFIVHLENHEPVFERDSNIVSKPEDAIYNSVFTRGSELLKICREPQLQSGTLYNLPKIIKEDDTIIYIRSSELGDKIRRILFDSKDEDWITKYLKGV